MNLSKEWFRAAGIRALKTCAQTAVATIGGSPGAGRLETGPFCVCPGGDPVLVDIGRRTSGGG